jgi:hypothetical protein
MNPPAQGPADAAPSVDGVRVRPGLTLFLWVLLVASAAAALGVQRGSFALSAEARAATPWVFLAFAVGFSVYRMSLLSVHKYSPAKAFFQVMVAATFSAMLFIGANAEKKASQVPASGDLAAALKDSNPTLRAFAAELARHRPDGVAHAKALVAALADADAAVAKAAHDSLVALNGGDDLGPASDAAARARWAEKFP